MIATEETDKRIEKSKDKDQKWRLGRITTKECGEKKKIVRNVPITESNNFFPAAALSECKH